MAAWVRPDDHWLFLSSAGGLLGMVLALRPQNWLWFSIAVFVFLLTGLLIGNKYGVLRAMLHIGIGCVVLGVWLVMS